MTHWWFHIYFDRGKLLSRTARATRSPISLHQPTYSHTIRPFPHILTCYKSISPYTWIVWNFCAQNPPYEIYAQCENLCHVHKYYQTYPSTWSHTIFNVLPKSNTIPTKGANYVLCVVCIYFLKSPDWLQETSWWLKYQLPMFELEYLVMLLAAWQNADPAPPSLKLPRCANLSSTHTNTQPNTNKHTQTQTDIESNITIVYKHGKQHKQIMPRKPCTMKTKNTFQSNFSSWIISQVNQALCKTPPLITDVRMRQWYRCIGFFAWMPWPLFLVIYCYH